MTQQRSLQEQLQALVASGEMKAPKLRLLKKVKPAKPAKAVAEPDFVPGQPGMSEVVVETPAPELPQTAAPVQQTVEQQIARTTKFFKGLNNAGEEQLARTVKAAHRLHAMVTEKLKGNRKPEARSAVESAVWLANAAKSLADAKASSDLSVEDLANTRAVSRSKLEALTQFFAAPNAEEAVEAVMLEDLPAEHFRKYARFAAQLPNASTMSRTGLRFKVIRVPVIALFSRIVQASDLLDAGFEVSDDGGYTVFHDQEVWCINSALLKDSDQWAGDEAGYVERLKTQAYKRRGERMQLVGSEGKTRIGHARAKGVSFYWAMPMREFRGLTNAADGAFVKDWGFAF